ncbi:27693_t:CDS:1, partial [Gigaspora margarita]
MVYKKILLLLENQHNKIKALIAKDKTHIPYAQNTSFYSRLIFKVSSFALSKVHKQFLKASSATYDSPLELYNGVFSTCMGLLCTHIIQKCLEMNQSLNLSNIYHHWWIEDHQLPLQNQLETLEHLLLQLMNELTHKYNSLVVPQQTAAQDKLVELISELPIPLLDPKVQQTR